MKRKSILPAVIFVLALLSTCYLQAQSVAINTDGTTAHSSAILDVKSTTKGILAPRMTTVQRTAIATPAAGLFVYDTDTNSYWYFNGSAWVNLAASGIAGSGTTNFISKFTAANTIGSSQLFDNGTNIGINTATPFGKLHIKGSADASQLIIDANATQSNTNPLIKLRKSDGTDLMWIHSDNPFNTFIGLNAGRVNNAGSGGILNTFAGSSAGFSNTMGNSNTANGYSALKSNTTGNQNTAYGEQALVANTTASDNTAIGTAALISQSYNPGSAWVSANTAVGNYALFNNQPTDVNNGIENTAVGHSALFSNTTGSQNTANGYHALYYNTTGIQNTANGKNALYENTIGNANTANGGYALLSNTIGNGNTANGSAALYNNTTGSENIANGVYALNNNTTASRNTAVGSYALRTQSYNNGGVSWETGNVAVGFEALFSNQPTSNLDGSSNTAVGTHALQVNSTGSLNTALGYGSLIKNIDGGANIAIGAGALNSNTSGNFNVAIGYNALINNVGGGSNIAIGVNSGTINFAPNINNTIGIGNNDLLHGSSNQVLIGNMSMVSIGGHVNWGVYSDARIKNTIVEDVKGLDFILKLRPVTYHISSKAITTITGNKETPEFPGKHDAEKINHSGFLAQEVEQAAKAVGYDFSGYTVPKNKNELYTIRYAEFVVPLVKAVQEQQAIIKTQQQQIDLLMKRIEVLEKK